jgi:diadenosine tetraphosphate (Ap4A) HIT family hydrolase
VHVHVLPRYEGERTHEGQRFPDAGWPGQPQLSPAVDLSDNQVETLTARLRSLWTGA